MYFFSVTANSCQDIPYIHNSEGSPTFEPAMDLHTGTLFVVTCGEGTKDNFFHGKMICDENSRWINAPECHGMVL